MGRSKCETRRSQSVCANGTPRFVYRYNTLGYVYSDGTFTVLWANAEAENVFGKIISPPR